MIPLFIWPTSDIFGDPHPTEAEIIRRRVASARKWRRRRARLRLKALVLPRRRRRPARVPQPAPAAAARC